MNDLEGSCAVKMLMSHSPVIAIIASREQASAMLDKNFWVVHLLLWSAVKYWCYIQGIVPISTVTSIASLSLAKLMYIPNPIPMLMSNQISYPSILTRAHELKSLKGMTCDAPKAICI